MSDDGKTHPCTLFVALISLPLIESPFNPVSQ